MLKDLKICLRFVFGTLILCSLLYPGLLLAVGQVLLQERASGSLIRDERSVVIGSRLIAQRFERSEYLWPRPSAVDYNAAAAGGSNLAASNPELRRRAITYVARFNPTADTPVPAELVSASGSGLDPHITLDGALHQVERIARARNVNPRRVAEVIRSVASPSNPWTPGLVRVLEANCSLDAALGSKRPSR